MQAIQGSRWLQNYVHSVMTISTAAASGPGRARDPSCDAQLTGRMHWLVTCRSDASVTDGPPRRFKFNLRRLDRCNSRHGYHVRSSYQARFIIWKTIPVRIFYTIVIYQGYDMDILSGKSYDVIYQGYDMDIPNANILERHILVIYFLTFGQIF